jgi:inner membrane protein
MLAFTHTATGTFLASAVALIIRPSFIETMLLLFGGLAGSLLPDLDHPKSWLGRRIPIISIPLSALVGHRGVTHSLIALFMTCAITIYGLSRWDLSLNAWSPLVIGLCIGYASHLFGDWATPSGIPLMWPSLRRYKSPVTFFTGCFEEKLFAYALWAGSAYMSLHLL